MAYESPKHYKYITDIWDLPHTSWFMPYTRIFFPDEKGCMDMLIFIKKCGFYRYLEDTAHYVDQLLSAAKGFQPHFLKICIATMS